MATLNVALLTALLLHVAVSPAFGQFEGIYCGKDNCYDLLGVTRESTKSEITKAYRKLARKWHPDMHKKQKDKEKASEMFQKIANAYENLKDEETRKDYDYMLDNPDEYYRHYFYYYRRKVAPQVDVRIVIAVTISVISVIQYWSQWNNYYTAISYFVTVPKYRLQATEIAKADGLLKRDKKKERGKTKEEIREEEENILKKVIEEKMDIRGAYSKPTVLNVLWIQLVMSPYYIGCYLVWYARWIWKFTIKREEYGEEEKEYLIRKYMSLSQGQWDSLEDHDVDSYMKHELWIKDKFKVWKQEKDDEMRAKLADNARYKSYRRWMKKGGAGQITFAED